MGFHRHAHVHIVRGGDEVRRKLVKCNSSSLLISVLMVGLHLVLLVFQHHRSNTKTSNPIRTAHISMAAGASKSPTVNGTEATNKALELAVDLPHSPGLKLHLHLTILGNSVLLFLTSTSTEAGPGATSMGSFVYALPDVGHVTQYHVKPELIIHHSDTILHSL